MCPGGRRRRGSPRRTPREERTPPVAAPRAHRMLCLLGQTLQVMAPGEPSMGKIDDIDMKILSELVKDAGLSVPKLSKKISVNPSVVYSRIKRLLKRGLIKRYTVE